MKIVHENLFTIRATSFGVILLTILVLITGEGKSQEVKFLPLTKITTTDGLSALNVRKIYQDKFGFTWCGTQDGLSLFDGNNFLQISLDETLKGTGIKGNDFFDFAIENDGNFWVISVDGALSKVDIYRQKVVESFYLSGEVHEYSYKSIATNERYVFIGTKDGVLLKFDKKTHAVSQIYLSLLAESRSRSIDKLYIDDFNRLWIVSSQLGVIVTDTSFSRVYKGFYSELSDSPESCSKFNDLCVYRGMLILATACGVKAYGIQEVAEVELNILFSAELIEILKGEIHSLSISKDKLVLVGPGLLIQTDLNKRNFSRVFFSRSYKDRSWLLYTSCVLLTSNSIWIGSQYGLGIVQSLDTPFTGYYMSRDESGINIEHATGLYSMNDSITFACVDEGLLVCNLRDGVFKSLLKTPPLYSLLSLDDKTILISGVGGSKLVNLNGSEVDILKVYPEISVLKKLSLISMFNFNDTLFYFATISNHLVYEWNRVLKRMSRLYDYPDSLIALVSPLKSFYKDHKDRLWILRDFEIDMFSPLSRESQSIRLKHPATKRKLGINMDMCEAGGKYWLACYGVGIVELTKDGEIENIYGRENGLTNLGLYKIYSFGDSLIVASSNDGLVTFQVQTKRIEIFNEASGLHANTFEQNSGSVFGNKVVFGGTKGITLVDIKKIILGKITPRLLIRNIKVQSQNTEIDLESLDVDEVRITSDIIRTTINFSVVNSMNLRSVKYSYRLIGSTNEWSIPSNQSFVTLIGVAPNRYRLEVKAVNEFNVPSEIKQLTLIFLPKWYQTWWFKVLIGLLVLGIVYGLYRLRINQLKKEEAIRNQLASDLHDDLGSTLNSVKVYANLAMMDKDNNSYLIKIKESTQEAIVGVRDLIWVLDDKKDAVDDLVNRVQQFAGPYCEANGVKLVVELAPDSGRYTLGKEEKRSLYLIMKEFVNNSIKYAQCTEIKLNIAASSGRIAIQISDNGKGFEIEKIKEGNGLRNFKSRAKEIHYSIGMDSIEGAGTRLTLKKA